MNYQKHYNLLVDKARTRIISGYSERHHIVPRCMGGSNKKENIVRLTAEEHYVAHQLLVKIYPDNYKLVFAANMMCVSSPDNIRNNKRYAWLRKLHSIAASNTKKGKQLSTKGIKTGRITSGCFIKGSVPHNKGVTGIFSHTQESKDLMSKSRIGLKNALGFKHTDDAKASIGNSKKKPQTRLTCPHCHNVGGNAMRRWHFDNCKILKSCK